MWMWGRTDDEEMKKARLVCTYEAMTTRVNKFKGLTLTRALLEWGGLEIHPLFMVIREIQDNAE